MSSPWQKNTPEGTNVPPLAKLWSHSLIFQLTVEIIVLLWGKDTAGSVALRSYEVLFVALLPRPLVKQ